MTTTTSDSAQITEAAASAGKRELKKNDKSGKPARVHDTGTWPGLARDGPGRK